ncbi:MAG: hypothetical protein AAFY50_13250 [Cyanobacteria bacterium J06648_1]
MIYLPPPQPTPNKDIRVSGDVEIHPTASLASGAILQAAPNRKIVIGADVCIGMGAIVNAAQGSVEIGNGAILGAGVLIIGASKIGSNCCIGTSSTIVQADVEAMAVIEPGSILGDSSRKVEPDKNTEPASKSKMNGTSPRQPNNTYSYGGNSEPANVSNFNTVSRPSPVTEAEVPPQSSLSQNKEPVVGQLYINELLITLFPHNKNRLSDSANQQS